MSISAGVVVAVTFQQIDNAPHAQASAQSNHQSLKNIHRRIKKCHKKVPPKIFYLKARYPRIQEMLPLSGCSVLAGHINVKGFKLFARFQFELGRKKTLYVKGVFLIKIG